MNWKNSLLVVTSIVSLVAVGWLAQAAWVAAQSNGSQLYNNPNIDGATSTTAPASGTQQQTTTRNSANPAGLLWVIVPLVVLGGVALYLRRPRGYQPVNRHQYHAPYSMAGAKGGETEASRTDNDVYAESLNDQERRLRRFYDTEPTPDSDRDRNSF